MMNMRNESRHPRMRAAILAAGITGIVGLAACDLPSAMGEANSLIIVADDAIWDEVEDDTYAALERTVYTTRNEKIFNVTQTDPRVVGNRPAAALATDPRVRDPRCRGDSDDRRQSEPRQRRPG